MIRIPSACLAMSLSLNPCCVTQSLVCGRRTQACVSEPYPHGQRSCAKPLSCVQLFGIPRTVASQAPLSMRISRRESWSGLPYPPPHVLLTPLIDIDLSEVHTRSQVISASSPECQREIFSPFCTHPCSSTFKPTVSNAEKQA